MLIVAGHFVVDPADRDAFLAGRADSLRATRTEGGCLEYVMSADPIDETRVVLFERWADQSALDAHLAEIAKAPRGSGPAPKGFEVKIYDIAGERAFG
jgi:quinol monooxygenase YgiN